MKFQINKNLVCSNSLVAILLLIGIGLISNQCSNIKVATNDEPFIEIGNYVITEGDFGKDLEDLKAGGGDYLKGQQLLDTYISAGLLVQLAKDKQIDSTLEFQNRLEYFKNELLSNCGKALRLKSKSLVTYTDSQVRTLTKNTSVIDYVWIPKDQKDLSKQIMDRLNSGASVDELVNSNKYAEWDKLHLKFYTNLSTDSAPLTMELLTHIQSMETGKFTTLTTQSGYHLIKVIHRSPNSYTPQSVEKIKLNFQIADGIENGDTLLDPYVLNKAVKINEALLFSVPFYIKPLLGNNNEKNQVIGSLFGKSFYKDMVISEISKFPVNVQAVFRNKSTRSSKVLNLLLTKNSSLYHAKILDSANNKSLLASYLRNKLRQYGNTDTLAFLVKLLQNNSDCDLTNLYLPSNSTTIKTQKERYKARESNINSALKQDISWVYNENLPGEDDIKLNLSAISNMEFPGVSTLSDNNIVAYNKERKLKLIDIQKELNKLTPASRLAISESDGLNQLIHYLLNKNLSTKQFITINKRLAANIDIIGSSIDSLHSYKSRGTVGSLMNVSLTEDQTMRLVSGLPKVEQVNFTSDPQFVKEGFKKLLLREFWKKQVDLKLLKNDVNFNNKFQRYKNWLMSTMYYQSYIYVKAPETDDERLNIQLRMASKVVSEEKLTAALRHQATHTAIKINHPMVKSLGIAYGHSIYDLAIKKNRL